MASEGSTSASESLAGKQKSRDFADQIRQLELEGSKLLEATYTLSSSFNTPNDTSRTNTTDYTASSSKTYKATDPSLSELTDISAEQKTIEDLRVHLDAQSRETERLQKSLAEPSLGLSRFPLTTRSSSLSALNLPLGSSYGRENYQDLGASGHTFNTLGHSSTGSTYTPRHQDYTSQSQTHMERQIKELQDEVNGLRHRLRQALGLGEEQKHSFRLAQDELKRQLTSALSTKDSIIEVKMRELSAQEALVTRLQANIERLEANQRLQEETLLELNSRCETSQKGQYVMENVTSQLRKMVGDRERRRGRPFSDTENFSTQSLTMLLHHIERYSSELETENEQNSLRVRQMTAELDSLKSASFERQHSSSRSHQDRLTEIAESHDKELSQAVERSMTARSQVTTLQEQLSVLRQESSQRLADRDDQISHLKRNLESAKLAHSREQEEWHQKKQALEAAMDATQKEVGELKRDHDDAIYRRAKLESKVDELEKTITELEGQLKELRSLDEALCREKEGIEQELSASSHRLGQSEQEVQRLQTIVQAAKLESNAQLQTAVATLEREEKEKAAGQLQIVTARLGETTERLHELTLQHEVLKAEHKNLVQRHKDLEVAHAETSHKVEAAQSSKENLTTSLQGQMTEIGRLSQEKDYYLKLSEERGKEVGELRVEVDKLAVQLEERQKNFSMLKDQNDKINHLLENSSETTRALREERDKLTDQLTLRVTDAEQRKATQDHLAKKMKIREKHLRDLQEDNQQMAELLATNKEELEQLTREKDALYNELKDSRYEVSGLKETNAELDKKLNESEDSLRKELERVTEKLKGTESDLKLAKKAMKTKEHVDGKAVRVAGKMQKEVTEKRGQIDSLQSKVRWLEECLENIVKEKKFLKHESEKLSGSLQKSVSQNERLTTDLGGMSNREKDTRERMNKLEAALEKAAVKHAGAQAQIEQFEQDIARLKLKHQLEMKELVRSIKTSPADQHIKSAKAVMTQSKAVAPTVQTLAALQALAASSLPKTASPDKQVSHNSQQSVDTQITSGVGNELRELLHEMRSLVQSGKQAAQPAPPPHRHYHHPPAPALPGSLQGQTQTGLSSHHTAYSYNTPPSTATTASSLDHLGQSTNIYTSSLRTADLRPTKQSSRGQSGSRSKPISYVAPPKRETEERYMVPSPSTSPVSDLLADTFSYKDVQDTVSSITGITDDIEDHTELNRNPQGPDTNVLCKRLEKKLQKLSKLGSHLVDENREIGEMMKNQDMQLKKVRNGKLLKA